MLSTYIKRVVRQDNILNIWLDNGSLIKVYIDKDSDLQIVYSRKRIY